MGGIEFLNMAVCGLDASRPALRCVCDCDSGLLFSVKGQHRRILLAARVVVSLEAGASTHVWVSLFQALSRARARTVVAVRSTIRTEVAAPIKFDDLMLNVTSVTC